MYIHRALLLVLLIMYIFTPSIQSWITEDGSAWYRPYLVWITVIFSVLLLQLQAKRRHNDL